MMTFVSDRITEIPLYFRGTTDKPQGEKSPETVVREKKPGERGNPLLCVQCGTLITRTDARITVAGKQEHTCLNPEGIVYHIGCFQIAQGCSPQGGVYSHWSWFAGHTWQVLLCTNCGLHLGWLFSAIDSGFYGLILGRLHEQDEESDLS